MTQLPRVKVPPPKAEPTVGTYGGHGLTANDREKRFKLRALVHAGTGFRLEVATANTGSTQLWHHG